MCACNIILLIANLLLLIQCDTIVKDKETVRQWDSKIVGQSANIIQSSAVSKTGL